MRSILIIFSLFVANIGFGQQISVQNNELKYRITGGTIKTAADKAIFQLKIDTLTNRLNNSITDSASLALKLFTSSSVANLQAYTSSNYAYFDGSTWERKNGDTTSNGGGYAGTLIRVSSSFYWQRICDYVTPEMFGASPTSLDNKDAIQKAINSFHTILFTDTYTTSAGIVVSGNKTLNFSDSSLITVLGTDQPIDMIDRACFYLNDADNVTFNSPRIEGVITWYERVEQTDEDKLLNPNFYWINRSKGRFGIVADNSSNLKIYSPRIGYVVMSTLTRNCDGVYINNGYSYRTNADGFAFYQGTKNVLIENCIGEYNNDDTYSIYSFNTGGATQSENITFRNNIARLGAYRGLLNHGGKNVTFDNNVIDRCKFPIHVQGNDNTGLYPDILDTYNTTIKNNKVLFDSADGLLSYTSLVTISKSFDVDIYSNEFVYVGGAIPTVADDGITLTQTIINFLNREVAISIQESDNVKIEKNILSIIGVALLDNNNIEISKNTFNNTALRLILSTNTNNLRVEKNISTGTTFEGKLNSSLAISASNANMTGIEVIDNNLDDYTGGLLLVENVIDGVTYKVNDIKIDITQVISGTIASSIEYTKTKSLSSITTNASTVGDQIIGQTTRIYKDGTRIFSRANNIVNTIKDGKVVYDPLGIDRGNRKMSGTTTDMLAIAPIQDGMYFYNTSIKRICTYDNVKGLWVTTDGLPYTILSFGTFASKPSSSATPIGYRYFCTDKQTPEGGTNGITIFHKGSGVWVDALGRTVL